MRARSKERLLADIREELTASLGDLADGPHDVRVVAVVADGDLDAGTYITVSASSRSARRHDFRLPATLAIGYLADEEAAVDEWRRWVHDVWEEVTGLR